jgi:hypothetical protein
MSDTHVPGTPAPAEREQPAYTAARCCASGPHPPVFTYQLRDAHLARVRPRRTQPARQEARA